MCQVVVMFPIKQRSILKCKTPFPTELVSVWELSIKLLQKFPELICCAGEHLEMEAPESGGPPCSSPEKGASFYIRTGNATGGAAQPPRSYLCPRVTQGLPSKGSTDPAAAPPPRVIAAHQACLMHLRAARRPDHLGGARLSCSE